MLKSNLIHIFSYIYSSVKIDLPHSSDILTVGWFMQEIERKIKEEKFFDVTT